MSDDDVSKQRTTCQLTQWPLTGMSDVLARNEYEGPIGLETAHSSVHGSGTLLDAFTPPAFSAGLADVRLT